MEETQVVTYSKNELIDIFATEEDKKGTDLLKMSNYFDIFVSKIDTREVEESKKHLDEINE